MEKPYVGLYTRLLWAGIRYLTSGSPDKLSLRCIMWTGTVCKWASWEVRTKTTATPIYSLPYYSKNKST